MKHVDEWLDEEPVNGNEAFAKEFLEHCRRPSHAIDYDWIERNPLYCSCQLPTTLKGSGLQEVISISRLNRLRFETKSTINKNIQLPMDTSLVCGSKL